MVCQYVLVCVTMCCLRCVVGCVSVGVDALAVVWWRRFKKKETKTKSVISKKKCPAREFISITVFINSKKKRIKLRILPF